MKKKIVTVVLMLCVALSLCACGGNAGNTEDTGKQNTEANSEANKDTEKESESENVDDGKIEYKVTLLDANGNPVAGQMIQVCNAENCFAPVATDANGVATFRLEESNEYKAKLLTAGEDAYVYFEAGATELTLTMAE
ncbi:MAG: hypothetical protein IJE49_05390 [Agathobacter sp.]|nr:hypothetical protein [Agathobacter sp.]